MGPEPVEGEGEGEGRRGSVSTLLVDDVYEVGDKRNEVCCNSATITIDHRDDKECLSPYHDEAPDLCLLWLWNCCDWNHCQDAGRDGCRGCSSFLLSLTSYEAGDRNHR